MAVAVIQGRFGPAGPRLPSAMPAAGRAMTPAQRPGSVMAGSQAVPQGLIRPTGVGRALPEGVRARMETFFGADFSDVRVHVGPEAASIGALAFAMGSSLYFAPGQYSPDTSQGLALLGHELTHVVQQRQGRVRNPFGQGVALVQDPLLEAEADRMGHRAASYRPPVAPLQAKPAPAAPAPQGPPAHSHHTVQCMKLSIKKAKPGGAKKSKGHKSNAGKFKFKRPNFSTKVYSLARMAHVVLNDLDIDPESLSLSDMNAAVPHRMSWENMSSNVRHYLEGDASEAVFLAWTDQFLVAGTNRIQKYSTLKAKFQVAAMMAGSAPKGKAKTAKMFAQRKICYLAEMMKEVKDQGDRILVLRKSLIDAADSWVSDQSVLDAATAFLQAMNNYHPNVPDLGPHCGVNIQVSKYTHLNFTKSGNLTPTSGAINDIPEGQLNQIATDKTGKYFPTTSGNQILTTDTVLDMKKLVKKLRLVARNTKEMEYDGDSFVAK